MLTQARVRELFDHCLTTGRLVRKVFDAPGQKSITDGVSAAGYFIRWVDGICYREHNLVWLWHTGEMVMELDHRNRNKLDNRIRNLRPATRSLNNANQSMKRNNTSGYKGVSAKDGKWMAQITVNGDWFYLGRHATPEIAALAYNKAAFEHHGEFAYLNEVPNC